MPNCLLRALRGRVRAASRATGAVPCLAAMLLLAAATSAGPVHAAAAGPPGHWTRVTGATLSNSDEVAVARTSDGALHVVWRSEAGGAERLMHAAIAADGRLEGPPNAVVQGWSSVGTPALVVGRDGSLHVFFGGIRSTNSNETNNSMNAATAGSAGASWSLVKGSVVHTTNAYASTAAAALESSGTPVTGWATSYGLGVHVGLNPAAADEMLQKACCAYQPALAVDASSGAVVLAWFSDAGTQKGILVQGVAPAGARLLAPGSASSPDADEHRTGITARLGAPGVFVAYCAGAAGSSFCRSVDLWRYGGVQPLVVARAPNAVTHAGRRVSAAPGPDGRIWVMWTRGHRIYASRTNRAATRPGPVVSTAPPPGMSEIWKLDGDGANGPLDLLASVDAGDGGHIAAWHTQLLPPLQVRVQPSSFPADSGATIRITVTDVGDPVSNARVAVAGRSLTTDAAGRAVLTMPKRGKAGSFPVRVTKPGYAAAAARLSARIAAR